MAVRRIAPKMIRQGPAVANPPLPNPPPPVAIAPSLNLNENSQGFATKATQSPEHTPEYISPKLQKKKKKTKEEKTIKKLIKRIETVVNENGPQSAKKVALTRIRFEAQNLDSSSFAQVEEALAWAFVTLQNIANKEAKDYGLEGNIPYAENSDDEAEFVGEREDTESFESQHSLDDELDAIEEEEDPETKRLLATKLVRKKKSNALEQLNKKAEEEENTQVEERSQKHDPIFVAPKEPVVEQYKPSGIKWTKKKQKDEEEQPLKPQSAGKPQKPFVHYRVPPKDSQEDPIMSEICKKKGAARALALMGNTVKVLRKKYKEIQNVNASKPKLVGKIMGLGVDLNEK